MDHSLVSGDLDLAFSASSAARILALFASSRLSILASTAVAISGVSGSVIGGVVPAFTHSINWSALSFVSDVGA